MKIEFERIKCLYCHSERKTKITEIGQFAIPTHVVICKECGLMYLNPRWTPNRYHQFYVSEYENYYPRTSSDKQKDNRLPQLVANRLYEFREDQVFENILDIGSGFGDILLYFKNNRFKQANYYAIEPSSVCIDFLTTKNIKVISPTVDNNWNESSKNKFDLIIMRHVLEHLLDPLNSLKKISSTLTKDGLLYIAIPDAYHPLSPLNSYYFRAVHTAYFNKDTIHNLLYKAGLKVVELKDNLNGELYVIAKQGDTERPTTFINAYKKQLKIISSTYTKEKGSGKTLAYLKAKLISITRKIK
ncbi:class I SAM-dependent methyltransferase [Pedobacter sp. SD-b]|uniref:Class I SAM-dependent methyltransferase n=1 Tax=Pedobacter segetis TaxID=2793069 RepID=A0ABS1BGT1_9SPHI|nr:class I SAM-dependent methyltransferase [Pedobacter segetis]MBK0382081.1 class I SAM-dependent methyltransferase [Pedobacter segetis]